MKVLKFYEKIVWVKIHYINFMFNFFSKLNQYLKQPGYKNKYSLI